MSAQTSIEWTDRTWNPIIGCSRVSEGCRFCYAERQAIRQVHATYAGLVRSTPDGPRWTGEVRFVEDRLDEPLSWREPARIFVDSMGDLFHEDVTDDQLDQVFAVMALTPRHTFQLLTKRPERMLAYLGGPVASESTRFRVALAATYRLSLRREGATPEEGQRAVARWPLPNVIVGTSVENQEAAEARMDHLLETPAACRMVSYEPALGLVDFRRWLLRQDVLFRQLVPSRPGDLLALPAGREETQLITRRSLGWLVVGGESGPHARPFLDDWARVTIKACQAAQVPVFVKQLGSRCLTFGAIACQGGSWPDGTRLHTQVHLTDPRWAQLSKKGGLMEEWPADLRVREWPQLEGA